MKKGVSSTKKKSVIFKKGDRVKTFDGLGTVISKFKDLGCSMVVVRYWMKHKAKYRYECVENSILQFQVELKKENVKYNKRILSQDVCFYKVPKKEN